ncbi:prolyl oligopeptidase family serine peptidase [Sphingobacterium oryzagri]|uniref:Prolyl oligopeptidase family serine peptidase n=1 Tax=Sphingobacterium oryzagri TaxID=3025669 RepID=A0ABY7WIB6_9SPHI|nr:prolyl oligopeptidase family serine peptidase [Sphingobacterium sp. KACC 22765]WDF68128.1 prolyl oligopeptidase family serine peptidase [Sphingobacterium sp. KACC 22765]
MKHKFSTVLLSVLAFTGAYAQENKTPLKWQDIPGWSYFRTTATAISPDGKWIAYQAGPTQGDLTLTLKNTENTTAFNYKIGGEGSSVLYNEDGRYLAFLEAPDFKTIKSNEKAKKPSSKKLRVVSLKDTASTVFDKVQQFDFSKENGKWLAIRFESAPGPKNEQAGKGNDLLLYNLDNKQKFNLGNVSDYAFNKSGEFIAYTVDATGKNGNGIFLLNLQTGLTSVIQNDDASFSKINWNKEGTAFSLLKSKENKDYKTPIYTLIGVKNLQAKAPEVHSYSGLQAQQISAGYGISENTVPFWSKDLSTIFFGIAKIEKKEDKKDDSKEKSPDVQVDSLASTAKTKSPIDSAASRKDSTDTKIAATDPKKNAQQKKDLEKPDMIIWNWQDKRLQSSQRVQLESDKRFTILSAWQVAADKFVSLSDSSLKAIYLAPNQLIGYGLDFTPYEYISNLDGQSYADLYIVDVKTGNRKLAIEKLYLNASRTLRFSPTSTHLLYYSDGDFQILDVKTLAKTNISKNIPASFVDMFDDHNVTKPSTGTYGWAEDGRYVLLKDNFDLWKVSFDGKSVTKLTNDWAKQQWTSTSYSNIYPDDENIDLSKDQYFGILNIATKQTGIALLPAKSNKMEVLKMDDVYTSSVKKVKKANTLFYTTQSSTIAPELFISHDNRLKTATKLLSDSNKHVLSAGSKLISYVSDHGDTLQAVLYLPANYEEGKSYPTITYIYERLTDNKNTYSQPAFPGGGFNRAMYTSNGYAVLMPDIKYKMNDPGMSAVACVVPAVKAAVATGIVDEKNVAIHGHSWGGYQTSFLITQTDIFKAAVAGAPLTNMISMYSLIYWNTGSANQSIFESSQGRFTSGYWDNWDAYARNSPIFHIKKVKTPLIILHNDKDGAVDYTQGIEYFNGLRRLNKPVVMLTYNGENHGLRKEVNQKDYAVRMMEYFDHYLKGKDAPDWWAKGIDYIDLSKHLEERAF